MADERKVRVSRREMGTIRVWLLDEILRLTQMVERHQAMLAEVDRAMTDEARTRLPIRIIK